MFCGNELKSIVIWSGRRLDEDCAAGQMLSRVERRSRKIWPGRGGRIVERDIAPSTVATLNGGGS